MFNIATSEWLYSWATTDLNLYDVIISVTAYDDVSLSGYSEVSEIEIDNTAPSPSFVNPLANSHLSGSGDITVLCDNDTVAVVFGYDNGTWYELGGV